MLETFCNSIHSHRFIRDTEGSRRVKVDGLSNPRLSNGNLDSTLSVATVLQDLKMSELNEIFEREEVTLT